LNAKSRMIGLTSGFLPYKLDLEAKDPLYGFHDFSKLIAF